MPASAGGEHRGGMPSHCLARGLGSGTRKLNSSAPPRHCGLITKRLRRLRLRAAGRSHLLLIVIAAATPFVTLLGLGLRSLWTFWGFRGLAVDLVALPRLLAVVGGGKVRFLPVEDAAILRALVNQPWWGYFVAWRD